MGPCHARVQRTPRPQFGCTGLVPAKEIASFLISIFGFNGNNPPACFHLGKRANRVVRRAAGSKHWKDIKPTNPIHFRRRSSGRHDWFVSSSKRIVCWDASLVKGDGFPTLIDFHALRHTYASFLSAAGVPEGARVKMARHSEWRQTNHYTDPSSIPLLAGVEKLASHLPSSIASPNSGKKGQNLRKGDQSESPKTPAEIIAIDDGRATLANAVPSWENLALASPRGFEPRFSP